MLIDILCNLQMIEKVNLQIRKDTLKLHQFDYLNSQI